MADPDWSDPCAVHAWLEARYPRIVAGEGEAAMQHLDTSVTFTRANVREMAALMRQKASECAAKQGKPRRRAFVAG